VDEARARSPTTAFRPGERATAAAAPSFRCRLMFSLFTEPAAVQRMPVRERSPQLAEALSESRGTRIRVARLPRQTPN
jgi:hypothetical protein